MKKIAVRLVALFAAVAAMTVVEAVWRPGYALKSAIKWLLFGGVMVLPLWGGWKERMRWLAPRRDKALNAGLFLGAAACAAVVGGYFALRGAIDFSGVVTGLAGKEGITGQNFLFVALYICLANSFLEEAFSGDSAILDCGTAWGKRARPPCRRRPFPFTMCLFWTVGFRRRFSPL